MMKKIAILFSAIAMFIPTLAFADSAEGIITSLDVDNNILVLDNGTAYEVPGEFDYTVIEEGMKVRIFYDKKNNKNYIMEIEPEEK